MAQLHAMFWVVVPSINNKKTLVTMGECLRLVEAGHAELAAIEANQSNVYIQ